jgi:hypothetical protein
MALTGLRTNYAWGTTYEEGRNYFIKLVEDPALLNGTKATSTIIPVGSDDLPTIGYGYDLSRRPAAEIDAFLRGVIGALSQDQEDAMTIIGWYKSGNAHQVDIVINGIMSHRALTKNQGQSRLPRRRKPCIAKRPRLVSGAVCIPICDEP